MSRKFTFTVTISQLAVAASLDNDFEGTTEQFAYTQGGKETAPKQRLGAIRDNCGVIVGR